MMLMQNFGTNSEIEDDDETEIIYLESHKKRNNYHTNKSKHFKSVKFLPPKAGAVWKF